MREKRVRNVLDAACGTGVDSVMLLEEGFKMTSSDASDKMLKGAHKTRWERRKEPLFDDWVIEEANWLTLQDDIVSPPGRVEHSHWSRSLQIMCSHWLNLTMLAPRSMP